MLVQKSHPSTSSPDLIHIYLREIGRIPLLTPTQEIVYGHQVQQMMSLLSIKETLAVGLRREPTLAEWAAQVSSATLFDHLPEYCLLVSILLEPLLYNSSNYFISDLPHLIFLTK